GQSASGIITRAFRVFGSWCRCDAAADQTGKDSGASRALSSQIARKIRAVHHRPPAYGFLGKRVQTRAPDGSNRARPTGRPMSLNPGYQARTRLAIGGLGCWVKSRSMELDATAQP